MKPIAILGCGPAGLLVAHACAITEMDFVIYSRPIKSEMYGAMYLHQKIPGITRSDPDFEIQIIKQGCREGYAENVYRDPEHEVSWDKFDAGVFPAWSLSRAYDRLWSKYSGFIQDQDISYDWLQDLVNGRIIFNTIPKMAICNGDHLFDFQSIWVVRKHDFAFDNTNMIYYNGLTPDGKYGQMGQDWYRYSQINGLRSWEYSFDPGGNLYAETVQGNKPISNNCDCHPFVHMLGRYGKWKKGVLTHHAFNEAVDTLALL